MVSTFFFMPDATARILVHDINQFRDGMRAITHHIARHPLGHRDQLAVNDQHAVIKAGDEAFHQYGAASGMFLGFGKPGFDLVVCVEVDRHATPVIGIQRLDHHRMTDACRRPRGLARIIDHALLGDRQTEIAQQIMRVFLVAGDFHGDMFGFRGDRGLNTLLIFAVSKLNQRPLIEPDPGDITLFGGLDQRPGRGAKLFALRAKDKAAQLLFPVKVRIEIIFDLILQHLGQKVHQQPHRQFARRKADIALMVLIDHVVLTDNPGAARTAKGDIRACNILHFYCAMLQHMTQPGPVILLQTTHKAARFPIRAPMFRKTRKGRDQPVGKRGSDFRGWPVFQNTQIDDVSYDREACPDIRADENIG